MWFSRWRYKVDFVVGVRVKEQGDMKVNDSISTDDLYNIMSNLNYFYASIFIDNVKLFNIYIKSNQINIQIKM